MLWSSLFTKTLHKSQYPINKTQFVVEFLSNNFIKRQQLSVAVGSCKEKLSIRNRWNIRCCVVLKSWRKCFFPLNKDANRFTHLGMLFNQLNMSSARIGHGSSKMSVFEFFVQQSSDAKAWSHWGYAAEQKWRNLRWGKLIFRPGAPANRKIGPHMPSTLFGDLFPIREDRNEL